MAIADLSRGLLRGTRVFGEAALAGALVLACAPAVDAATITGSFDVTGAVDHPGSYTLSSLQALSPQTESVTYTSAGKPVSASFTGPTLWSVLGTAGLTPVPGVKNSTLRNVVVATGSDGYKVAFSGGELNPNFGGNRAGAPDLVAYARDGLPLGSDGFARTVVPGDAAGGRYVSNLSNINVVQAPSSTSRGGGVSSSVTLSGLVSHPTTYDAGALAALPSVTENVTYTSAGKPVSATFTGVTLWSLLITAGLVTDPMVKNAELRDYVLVTGTDGYEATFSLGELDPRFGGGGAPDLVAFAENGAPLGSDGFARLVVPGDRAGGRYVSNLVSLQVFDATIPTPVPVPNSIALLLTALTGFAVLRRRTM